MRRCALFILSTLFTLSAAAASVVAQDLPDSRLRTAAEALVPLVDEGLCWGEYWAHLDESGGATTGLGRLEGQGAWLLLQRMLDALHAGDLDCREPLTCYVWEGHFHTIYRFAAVEAGVRLVGIFEASGPLAEGTPQDGLQAAWEACTRGEPLPEPPNEESAFADPPFSAELLSNRLQAQDTWRFRFHQPPEAARVLTMRVVSANPAGVEIESTLTDDAGAVVGTPEVRFSTWEKLESQARYPRDDTRVERSILFDVVAGRYEGWRYTVARPDGSALEALFGRDRPGPPLRFTVRSDGQTTMEMELLSFTEGEASHPSVH
jgi:hypothetical protein